jgi:endonuclease YncB( thermonuclease family)
MRGELHHERRTAHAPVLQTARDLLLSDGASTRAGRPQVKIVTALMLVAASLILSQPGFAQEKLCGAANAWDGDDLLIAGHDIRLHGIDAFEANQICTRSNGQTWACGEAARLKLQELVQGRGEACCQRTQRELTRGRVVMRCLLGERDVGREMVRARLAFDCPRYSRERYKADEASAKADKRGAWAGTFRPPWVQKGLLYCCSPKYPREFCPQRETKSMRARARPAAGITGGEVKTEIASTPDDAIVSPVRSVVRGRKLG